MLGGSLQFTHLGPGIIRGSSEKATGQVGSNTEEEKASILKPGRHWNALSRMNGPEKAGVASRWWK